MTHAPKRFAFIFPMASGHVNPTLPIARSLVELGHEVHYLNAEPMRSAIEGTGARFHSITDHNKELFIDPNRGLFENLLLLCQDLGFGNDMRNLDLAKHVLMERKLPGALRFLRLVSADAVVFCPVVTREAVVAARILNIPSISLNTLAGPGALSQTFYVQRKEQLQDPDEFIAKANLFEPELAATARMNDCYGLKLPAGVELPIGMSYAFNLASLNLVTTCEDLQDPMSEELADAYKTAGTSFTAVGPLLDRAGEHRAAGHREKSATTADTFQGMCVPSDEEILKRVCAARQDGRLVVLVSMGTVITGDAPGVGWKSRSVGADGTPCGLTGRELCHAAWAGAFDAFGTSTASTGPLIVVSLGPQDNPLGDIVAPANAICAPVLPQVEILNTGVDLFLTHGGQNSFTESLMHATPVVVCPGFGDQPVNATKAVGLGVGLKVDRPYPHPGAEVEAAKSYRADVCQALRSVLHESRFAEAAAACSERLRAAGGVPRAVELILETVANPHQQTATSATHRALAVAGA